MAADRVAWRASGAEEAVAMRLLMSDDGVSVVGRGRVVARWSRFWVGGGCGVTTDCEAVAVVLVLVVVVVVGVGGGGMLLDSFAADCVFAMVEKAEEEEEWRVGATCRGRWWEGHRGAWRPKRHTHRDIRRSMVLVLYDMI
jgi:hypothetical protein